MELARELARELAQTQQGKDLRTEFEASDGDETGEILQVAVYELLGCILD